MNVFHKVTVQSLKKNKTRTIVTIIGIILSASMICAVTTFTGSFLNYAKESAIYTEGNWHGFEKDTSYETYEAINTSAEVEEAVCLQQLGYAYAFDCENEFKPYLYVLGAGEHVQSVLPIHITSGTYPTSQKEILLPNHLYTNGGVKYALGDTITLDLGQRMLDGFPMTQNEPCYFYEYGDEVPNDEILEVRETRTYTVVGFYDRMSHRIEPLTSPGYTAITLADSDPFGAYGYDVYFRMEDPKGIYDFMVEQRLSGETNGTLLMYSGTFAFDGLSTMLFSLACIVICLIMFGSVALIYNAFAISVSERTKQFGLLSSVGATKKQLRHMVLFEALAVSAIGIPIGVLAGIGGIGVTLLFVGDKFRSMGFPIDMRLSVSPIAIAVAVMVALITVLISAWIPSQRATKVSAVEAIRQNRDVNENAKPVKTSRLTYRLFGLPGVLAGKHYKRNKKKYRATVLSLFMSVVLFVSASAFTDYLMETVTGGFRHVGYDLSMQAHAADFEKITPQELLNRINAAKGVTNGAFFQLRYVNVTIQAEDLTQEGIAFLDENQGTAENSSERSVFAYMTFVDDAAFRAMLQENGLSEKQYMDPANPQAVVVDGALIINYSTQRYETITFFQNKSMELTVQKEREIPGYDFRGDIVDANGNRTIIYYKTAGTAADVEERLLLTPDEAYLNQRIRVGATVQEKPFFLRESSGIHFIYPFSLAKQVFEDFHAAGDYYNFVLTSSDHTQSELAVQGILSDHGLNSKDLQNIAQKEESERNVIVIIRVFSYGFVVLISLIAAANVFNTISTNISLRRREFAMLKSVGMTQKDFHKMMNYECLLYGTRALLYGVPTAGAVTYLIYLAIMEGYETTFQLPWLAIGIAVLSVFFVVFITMMYSMSKLRKDNPIDALKNENL